MKKLLTFLLLLTSCGFAKAQYITADTTQANALCAEATELENKNNYDSALVLYRKAMQLYEKHSLWEKYYKSAEDEVLCLRILYRVEEASQRIENYLQKSEDHLREDSEAKAGLFYANAVISKVLRNNEKCRAFFFKSIAIYTELFGEDYPKVAKSYFGIASSYHNENNYPQALLFFQKSLELFLNLVGDKHPFVALVYNNIAIVHREQKQYEKALAFYQKSLAIRTEAFGNEHFSVGESYNNIANLYKAQGQSEKALLFYKKALDILSARYGENSPRVASVLYNMASMNRRLKKFEKALEYHQKSLAIKLQAFGEEDLSVANSYHSIGFLYHDMKQYEDALVYYQKSLKIKLKKLEKHRVVAMSFNNLALTLRESKQYDSAAFYHHQAIKAISLNFEDNTLHKNPKPEQALEKNDLMDYLRHKAEALTLLGQRKEALQTYAVAADCAKLAMLEADRENDKLGVVARAHAIHTQAALLHFVRGKRKE